MKKNLNQSILSSFLLTGITCTYTYLIIIIVSTLMYHHYYNSIFMVEILAEIIFCQKLFDLCLFIG